MEHNDANSIQQFRGPIITATGIFLGFMLDFTTGWMPTAFLERTVRDAIITVTIVSSISLMITVLYRMLRMHYGEKPAKYYNRTLGYFLCAICIPFLAMIIIIFWNLSMRV